jgi:ferredoxin
MSSPDDDAPRLKIDHQACLRSGQCAYLQPGLFEMNPDGAPVVLSPTVRGKQIDQAKDAIEMCPGQAIALLQARGA